MNAKMIAWVAAPLVLSAGVIWVSAQDPQEKAPSKAEGIKVAELANQLQTKEKQLAQKEAELRELEQRLFTLQTTLDQQRQELLQREEGVKAQLALLEQLRSRKPIDPQLIRTYEAMDPTAGAQALKELAAQNLDVAVALLGGMQAKKAGKLLEALALLDAKVAGKLSERVGLSKGKDEKGTPAA
jgi:flagellar motility protein MotE (MotC chaperone)